MLYVFSDCFWKGGGGGGGMWWRKLDFSDIAFHFVNHSQYLYDMSLQKSNAYNYEMTQNPSFRWVPFFK